MMCCKVPYIKELEKPPGEWCRHAAAGKGCNIYSDRPGSCAGFYCAWMLDPTFGPEWKPDKAKFVVYGQQNNVNINVAVDPNFPNAWMKAPFFAQIKKWVVDGAERGQFVFVRIGARIVAVLPDREVDLGKVGPQEAIVVSRRPGPPGSGYDVGVNRPEGAAA